LWELSWLVVGIVTDRVFVAYGTKFGATAEIAEAIGRALKEAALDVDVRRALDVRSLEPYRAVVLSVRWLVAETGAHEHVVFGGVCPR
jgi:menaquinone-dependent protoporphyrinogen IX oxidase